MDQPLENSIRCSPQFLQDSLLAQEAAEDSKPVRPILGKVLDGRITPIRGDSNDAMLTEENESMAETSGPNLRLQWMVTRWVPGYGLLIRPILGWCLS